MRPSRPTTKSSPAKRGREKRAQSARANSPEAARKGAPGPPSKDALLKFIRAQEGRIGKREIARAFNLKGADRIELKRLLQELKAEGEISSPRARAATPREDGSPPPVLLLEVFEPDADGDLPAQPVAWSEKDPPPKIVVAPTRRRDPALGPGDRFLGRLTPSSDGVYAYSASLIKKLPRGVKRLLGVYRGSGKGGRIVPVDKSSGDEMVVEAGASADAEDGDLVEAEALPGARFGLRKARVLARLGDPSAPRSLSLIAMHEHEIPLDFDEKTLAEAARADELTEYEGREDLRHLPLITIDPADARDHDDAVCAMADDDPENPGGWIVWVAIADVAHYVRPDTALDDAARNRGNSAYFPDRVAPMLPERLSADLCSLHEDVDRPCLAVRIQLSAQGAKRSHCFKRAVMRSRASLTYEQAQQGWEGEADAATEPVAGDVITPLFHAYLAARKAHDDRAPLDLDLPERKVILDAAGEVETIRLRDRFAAHRMIEEFMILANVCAAESLEAAQSPLIYRVHEPPNPKKLEALRDVLASIDIPLSKGQAITPRRLNDVLAQASDTPHAELVNMAVLRAQTQAYYAPENLGHFGLSLARYAHFTSPIRRYADLITHRALIGGLKLGPAAAADGLGETGLSRLVSIAEHISSTERRAMIAERDTVDRYLAAYLSERRGARFEGRISGVQRFGVFVKLDETGADGLVPIRTIGADYFLFDEAGARLVGERSGVELRMGQKVSVRLTEATPVSGGVIFELLDMPAAMRAGRRSWGAPRRATPRKAERKTKKSGKRQKR